MVTTAAGPHGVWPAGSVQRVDQETGETLVRYGFAQAIDPEAWAPLTDEDKLEVAARRETASATPVMERAVDPVTSEIPKSAPKPTAKSPAKKSTK